MASREAGPQHAVLEGELRAADESLAAKSHRGAALPRGPGQRGMGGMSGRREPPLPKLYERKGAQAGGKKKAPSHPRSQNGAPRVAVSGQKEDAQTQGDGTADKKPEGWGRTEVESSSKS